MYIRHVKIRHFRSIKQADIDLSDCTVLVGDNNVGKTTILEAIDLALGPDRLNRTPPVSEHDFYRGLYLCEATAGSAMADSSTNGDGEGGDVAEENGSDVAMADQPPHAEGILDVPYIKVEVTLTDLEVGEQKWFRKHTEFFGGEKNRYLGRNEVDYLDKGNAVVELRVTFLGWYDAEEDDFQGATFYTKQLARCNIQAMIREWNQPRSMWDPHHPAQLNKEDKRRCGFLYLRALRTGTRALSLERGSLLDIILRMKKSRPKIWEDVLKQLKGLDVPSATQPQIEEILNDAGDTLRTFVPDDWSSTPSLKVSNFTREHLRTIVSAFIAAGDEAYFGPYGIQGRGVVNMLVLALLAHLAKEKVNVIFGFEEPETAISPYVQKQVIHKVWSLSRQSLVTTHSPHVIEEYPIPNIVVLKNELNGILNQRKIELQGNENQIWFRRDYRIRFCEGLLTRRVLVVEGVTEVCALPAACRKLAEFARDSSSSLEGLGICTVEARGERNVEELARLYQSLGKQVFAVCDRQTEAEMEAIRNVCCWAEASEEHGFEDVLLKGTTPAVVKRFAVELGLQNKPAVDGIEDDSEEYQNLYRELRGKMRGEKGQGVAARFFEVCETAEEIPEFLRRVWERLKESCTVDSEGTSGDNADGESLSAEGVKENDPV